MKLLNQLLYQQLNRIRDELNSYIEEKYEGNLQENSAPIVKPMIQQNQAGGAIWASYDARSLEDDDFEYSDEGCSKDKKTLRSYSVSHPRQGQTYPKSTVKPVEVTIPDFLKKKDIKNVLETKSETFSTMLLRLIDEKGLKDSEVYKKANIDRRLFSKIRGDEDYVPSKKTAISFCLALQLDMDETKKLLEAAGYALSTSSSLSKSIDKGLSKSRYGIIILSSSFFEKKWPDYELRGLLSKEVYADNKVILPIWHNVDAKDILEYSPYLADKYALTTEIGLDELVYKVVEVIRPDIVKSHAIMHACRDMVGRGIKEDIHYKNIYPSEIRHQTLPNYLVIGSMLISSIFSDVSGFKFPEYVLDFARDADYEHEFLLWSAMASTYMDFINYKKIDAGDLKTKKDIYAFLLGYVNGIIRSTDEYRTKHNLTKLDCDELVVRFAYNHDQLLDYFDDSMRQKYKKILPKKKD